MPAGRLRKDDTYAPGTLFRNVTDALEAMTKRAMEVNRGSRDGVAPTSVSANGARRARRNGRQKTKQRGDP
jgi:hypothetical protein